MKAIDKLVKKIVGESIDSMEEYFKQITSQLEEIKQEQIKIKELISKFPNEEKFKKYIQ